MFGVPLVLAVTERGRKYVKPYFGGFAAVLIAFVIEGHVHELDPSFNDLALYYAPIIEEFAKALIILSFTKPLVDERGEGVYWVLIAIGLGFGLGENGLYTIYLLDEKDGVILILMRTLFPVALHIVTTVMTGWLIEKYLSGRQIGLFWAVLLGLLLSGPSILLHFAYNASAISG
jgi:RsiW-degrading membrane proteinase PrsW (M82 family)